MMFVVAVVGNGNGNGIESALVCEICGFSDSPAFRREGDPIADPTSSIQHPTSDAEADADTGAGGGR